jgi:hypothetical protein
MKSRRGAPKRVNTAGFACSNQQCPYSGISDAHVHALVGDGKHGPASRIQTFRCQACRTTFSARRDTPLYRLKTPPNRSQWYSLHLQKGWTLPRLNGSSATVRPPSPLGSLAQAGTLRSCTSALSVISGSLTSSWTNCAPGCATPNRCCGCGWPLIPGRALLPVLQLGPRTQNMAHLLIHSLRPILAPGCLPLFTSDGLNVYFSALTAHFGKWREERRRGRNVRRWQVEAGLIYGQVKKCYQRRKLVRVTPVMRLGTEADLTIAFQGLGLSGRLNTAFIERVNLTVRHGVAALARRTWATAKPAPHLLAHLEWWRADSHFVRPHASLRVALMQPRERGGKRLAQRYRQRTPAMAAGKTTRRWTSRDVLSYPLPPVPCFTM